VLTLLLPGVCLMLALRAVLADAAWPWLPVALLAALASHLADLRMRWRHEGGAADRAGGEGQDAEGIDAATKAGSARDPHRLAHDPTGDAGGTECVSSDEIPSRISNV
jgi:hypothetical protein